MLDLINSIEWEDYTQILTSGSPPVYLQLLIFNALVIAYVIYKKMTTKRNLKVKKSIMGKFVVLGINCIILFQDQLDIAGMIDDIAI